MKPLKNSFHPILSLGLICSSVMLSHAQASGFALIEQSASAQGLSYAGAAMMDDDASVMWFNPAQMTQIQDPQLIGALHFISPKVKFVDQGSTNTSGPNSDGGTLGIVPNIYWKSQVGNTHVGLGINVPYGQHLDYGETWVGRYHATETNLTTLQINPNIAYQLNQAWSLGLGLNAQYVDVLLAQKINQSLILSMPNLPDANAEVTGDNWAYGYNFGLSYHPDQALQVGMSYRSGFSHKVKGKVEYEDLLNPLKPTFSNATATADVNLPASFSLAARYAINPQTRLYADATWTEWSAYDQLIVKFDNPSGKTESKQNFQNAWRYAFGADYQVNEQLKLRTGVALDKTPVPDSKSRSPRTPDSDRYWFSVGLGYQFTPSLTFDLAYSHLYADKAELDYTLESRFGDITLDGKMDAAVDILSAQLVWRY